MKINIASIRNDRDGFDRIAAIATKTSGLSFALVEFDFSSCCF